MGLDSSGGTASAAASLQKVPRSPAAPRGLKASLREAHRATPWLRGRGVIRLWERPDAPRFVLATTAYALLFAPVMKTRQILILSSTALVSLAAMGCGGSDQPQAKSPDQTTVAMVPPPPNPPEPVSVPGASTVGREGDPSQTPPAALSAGNGPSPTEAQPSFSDAQILEITHTANVGEIEQAKLAQAKGRSANVKKFASMMLKQHSEADAKGMKIAKAAGLTLATSPTSENLANDAEHNTAAMKTQTGLDFDHAYVDAQVNEHQAVLDTIDQKLVPSAQSADVKSYLADVRTAVAMHLQHAKDLQNDLTATSTTSTGTTSGK
jgi:putative membrane protein